MKAQGWPAKRRRKLWEAQGGMCFYCRRPTRLPEHIPGYRPSCQPPDMATLEHLDPRCSPLRGAFPGEPRKVVACFACNNGRSVMQNPNNRRAPTPEQQAVHSQEEE